MSIKDQIELLDKNKDYTVDELMAYLLPTIKFNSKNDFGRYMRYLGYVSRVAKVGRHSQRVYDLRLPQAINYKIVLKQLYLLTKERRNGRYSIEEIRDWLTVKFKSNRAFGNFMKSIGYTSCVEQDRRCYILVDTMVYPISRTNRTIHSNETVQLFAGDSYEELYPIEFTSNPEKNGRVTRIRRYDP